MKGQGERLNVWVFWLSSLVMLGEVGERKKEQTWDAERERKRGLAGHAG
jgi:hypothetical protein